MGSVQHGFAFILSGAAYPTTSQWGDCATGHNDPRVFCGKAEVEFDPSAWSMWMMQQQANNQSSQWWKDFGKALITQDWTTGSGGKELCFVTFVKATAAQMNPLSLGGGTVADVGPVVTQDLGQRAAILYAAGRTSYMGTKGLIYPLKSGTVRSILSSTSPGKTAGTWFLVGLDLSMAAGVWKEYQTARAGECE